jgi:predicted O-linked N-acetylglucosamine transferase (SPINDLY family)
MPGKFLSIFRRNVAKNSDSRTPDLEFESARLLNERGQLAEAKVVCDDILIRQPDHWEALILLAELEAKLQNLERAGQLYARLIELRPDFAPAYYKRGNLLRSRGQLEAALANYDQAVSLDPKHANAFCNRGVVLGLLSRREQALASYDRAIELNPADALALYNRGDALRELKRFDDALASYDRAISAVPTYAEAHCNRGVLLQELKEWDLALDSYNRCIEINPGISYAYLNRGNLLRERKKLEMALANYDRAIEIDPANADAYCNRGAVLTELRQWEAAFASLNRAIELNPEHADAHCSRGQLLAAVMKIEGAIASFDKAIAIKPDFAEALRSRGDALIGLKQYAAAIASYDQAILLKPDFPYLLGGRRHAAMYICDWRDLESDVARIATGIEADAKVAPPFTVLALLDSARLQHGAARVWMRDQCPQENALPRILQRAAASRIRLGYFSGDFHQHPVALLAAELLESHDRSRFEVIAFSFGPDTKDEVRTRLEHVFDRFIDVRDKSDEEIAQLSRSLNIDIAIDLGGYTGYSRTRVFALRAAPLQISYLGYPGTMAADYIDYLIGDRTVIPEGQRCHYTEKIAFLPNSFLPHDSRRAIATTEVTRESLGLPSTGFVFCCFNNAHKITPATFDIWMRILGRVENSVLWLSHNDPTAANNLRQEAVARGIDAGRLVFANRLASSAEHLARQRVADLFLDTLPYNAHATALDALWAGLPVLTCMGEGFASRVAASLLNAIEMPELITVTPSEYESLAISLATEPRNLDDIRQKLARNRLTAPLFDTKALTRHLELAYSKVYERYQANLPPEDFHLDA